MADDEFEVKADRECHKHYGNWQRGPTELHLYSNNDFWWYLVEAKVGNRQWHGVIMEFRPLDDCIFCFGAVVKEVGTERITTIRTTEDIMDLVNKLMDVLGELGTATATAPLAAAPTLKNPVEMVS